MRRKGTLINVLKSSITDAKNSQIFNQTLYDSTNFNANSDTDFILNTYISKNAYQHMDFDVSFSKLRKEKMNAHFELGRKNAKTFYQTKLDLNKNWKKRGNGEN